MAVVRYRWMFRTAAVVFLLLGLAWLWTATATQLYAAQRPLLLGAGIIAIVTAVAVFRRARWAIVVSAIAAAIVGVSAALFIPNASGPGVLFLLGLAVVCGCYAALSFRAVFTPQV
jgi:hypothetical protein